MSPDSKEVQMYDLHFESGSKCTLFIGSDFIVSHADAIHKLQQPELVSGREGIQGSEKTMTFILTVL